MVAGLELGVVATKFVPAIISKLCGFNQNAAELADFLRSLSYELSLVVLFVSMVDITPVVCIVIKSAIRVVVNVVVGFVVEAIVQFVLGSPSTSSFESSPVSSPVSSSVSSSRSKTLFVIEAIDIVAKVCL